MLVQFLPFFVHSFQWYTYSGGLCQTGLDPFTASYRKGVLAVWAGNLARVS